LVGCGGKSPESGANTAPAGNNAPTDDSGSKNNEPVTLTFYQFYAGLSDKELDQYFIQPLKKKFPNVTLKKIYSGLQGPLWTHTTSSLPVRIPI
jgi:multiple sugar transport system substrate-binding protein